MTKLVATALLAAVVASGVAVYRADASVAASTKALTTFSSDDSIIDARWVCGASRCDWHAWVPGEQHRWSSNWGPPRNPGCYWEKRRGRWRQVCPW